MGNACASYEETDVVEVRPSPSSPTPLSPHQWRAQKLAKWSQADLASRQAFSAIDANGDGRLSHREIARAAKLDGMAGREAALFKGYDADGDGTLDFDEFKKVVATGRRAAENRAQQEGGGDGTSRSRAHRDTRKGAAELFVERTMGSSASASAQPAPLRQSGSSLGSSTPRGGSGSVRHSSDHRPDPGWHVSRGAAFNQGKSHGRRKVKGTVDKEDGSRVFGATTPRGAGGDGSTTPRMQTPR